MALANGHAPSPDLLDLWMDYTEGLQSPEAFRLWSGISLVGGCLERRVWTAYGQYVTFAPTYIMLVGASGTGKGIVNHARSLWQATKVEGSTLPAFHLLSHSVTKAAFIDELVKAKQVKITPEGPPLVYHSLLIAAEELEFLFPSYDSEFISTLNVMYNMDDEHRESRRQSVVKEVVIEKPTVHLLCGAQPSYLSRTFQDNTWNSGLARRMIMVYATYSPKIDIFAARPEHRELRAEILTRLRHLSSLYGQMLFEDRAVSFLREWNLTGGQPTPVHTKLKIYNEGRTLNLIKLSMVMAVAARTELVLRLVDVERALRFLLEAEVWMPDIFRDMLGKSDSDVITELHRYCTVLQKERKRDSIPGATLREFLIDRVPSEKIERLMDLADRAKIVCRVAGTQDMWLARVRGQE